MKYLMLFFSLIMPGSVTNAFCAHYQTDRLWETDSVLVAWVINKYVDDDATFSSVPKGTAIDKNLAINTANSFLRRSGRFTAFDAATRIYKVKSQCIEKIRPLIRILEMTPWRKHEHIEALQFEEELVRLIPTKLGRGGLEAAFTYIDSYCNPPNNKTVTIPDFISFIAFINNNWQIITMKDGKYSVLSTQQEPRTFDYDFTHKRIVYVGSDKSVRLVSEGKEVVLFPPGKDAFTQPVFSPNGEKVYLVKLINGNSVNTDIISLNISSKKTKSIISQRSTQLEPFLADSNNIYYSNVSCVEGCGKIIQDIWHKNIVANIANQLTLLNAISHQPTVDKKQKYLIFSSNKNGNYHIWRMTLKNNYYKQLTSGVVTDSFPAALSDGSVLFIRSKLGHNSLVKIDVRGNLCQILLPKEYTKIRDLKVKWK